jgi:hypothetical protein
MTPPLPDSAPLRGKAFNDFRTLSTLLEKDTFHADPTLGDLRRLILYARDTVDFANEPDVLAVVNRYARFPVNNVTKGLTRAARRVCRIENSGSSSTGILVGPDLVLTTAHDFHATDSGRPLVDQVTVVFDFFVFDDDEVRDVRVRPKPGDGGLVEVLASSVQTELDYVLFRLTDLIGLHRTADGRTRGWMDGSRVDVAPEGSVIVLQHPIDEFLQSTGGALANPQPEGRRAGHYMYDTDTLSGASGAAVLNVARQLVGMHLSRQRTSNGRGEIEHLVSFQAVVRDMNERFRVSLPRYPPSEEAIRILMEFTADSTFANAFER